MKLQEILDIVYGEKRLSEMSFSQKDIIGQFMNNKLLTNRCNHLLLIYYFRNRQDTKHWIGELNGFIPKSPYIKGKNKRFDEETIFHYIWKGYAEDFSPDNYHLNILKDVKYIKNSLPWESINQNAIGAVSFMEEFHQWTAKQLATEGEVSTQEIEEIIFILWDKYPI